MADSATEINPFLIFPEDIWGIILDKMGDSKDAWNLLKSFPQLDASAALQKGKRFWLFGLVIPHLIQWKETCWIKEQDLIKCRRVCKQWSTAVDGFLEGQPQLRAYQPKTQGQLPPGRCHWNAKAYLEAFNRQQDIYLGGTGFKIADIADPMRPGGPSVKRFHHEMEAQPPWRNPFLSRALSISIGMELWSGTPEPQVRILAEYLADVFTLHRKFGEHVWYYKLDFWVDTFGAHCMTEYLTQLPNLKLLHILADAGETWGANDVGKFLELVDKELPPLPLLETLRMDELCPPYLSHVLISRFSSQIRRLDVKLDLWRDEYYRLFPNLTELDITDWSSRPDGKELGNILRSLEAPKLAKLQLSFPAVDEGSNGPIPFVFVMEDDVFQWLKRFPSLKFLDIGYDCRGIRSIERGALDPAIDSVPSLQFLGIQSSFQMNYNFLRCLPSLQHLQLYVSSQPVVIDLSTNPSVKIREQIQTASMYKSNIWELLPKLRTMVLVLNWDSKQSDKVDPSYAFNREGYEFERRRSSKSSVGSGGDDDPLRKDIIEFLQEEFKYGNGSDPDGMEHNSSDQDDSQDSDIDEGNLEFNVEENGNDKVEQLEEGEIEHEVRL